MPRRASPKMNGKLYGLAFQRGAAVSLIALALTQSAHGQNSLTALQEMWKRQQYQAVLPLLIDYRASTKTRTIEIDYMIATSACRVSGARQTGDEFFGWILQNYNLNNENRALVEAERERCSPSAAPQRLGAMVPASLVGITYHGKGGTELRASSSGNGTAEVVEAIPPETFSARLFRASDAQTAVAQVGKLAGSSYQVQPLGHFLLVTPAPGRPVFPDSPDAMLPPRLAVPGQDATRNPGGIANRVQMPILNAARRPDPAPSNSAATGNIGMASQGPPPNVAQMPPLGAAPNVAASVRPPSEAATNAPSEAPARPNGPLNAAQSPRQMPPVEGAPGLVTSTRAPRAATPNAPSEAVQANAPPSPARSAVQGPAQHPVSMEPDEAAFTNAGEDLERYLQFFASEYRIPTPPYLITVYFASSRADLERLARTLHGIRLPGGSLGYSFPADQSMVGWADGKAYGTFAHELFHLTVRNGFGDIPPWLDEGMAALYEVSRLEGSRAAGLPNWRGEILRRLWATRPSIRELVQMNRSSFDDASGEAAQYVAGERQAMNHATARYFMLYLQQQGRLLPVYSAFQSREVNGQPAEQAIALLESTLHSSLDAVDADFARWFQQLPQW